MRIVDVRTVLLTGPCTDDPWLRAFRQERSAGFVEVVTDTGEIGLGETYAGYFFPESVPLIVDYVRPILLAAPAFDDPSTLDVGRLTHWMRTCIEYWGRSGLGAGVLAGVEAALWDLKGKLLGVPAYRLLAADVEGLGANPEGTAPAELPGYATGGPSNWPVTDLFAKVDFYLGLGFTAVKVASGYKDTQTRAERPTPSTARGNAEQEAEKVAALRDHVGSDVGIMLDGHMGHREGPDRWDLETARAVLEAVAPYGVTFFEEPLSYEDLGAYAELSRSSPVPVAGGEQLSTYGEFALLAERDAVSVAQPDAAWLGPADFVRVARLFADHDRTFAPHSWGAGAAVMQNVHAAFATPGALIVELPPAAGPLHREVWGDALTIKDGKVLRPEAPGFGAHLTEEIKNAYAFRPGAEEFSSVPGKMMPR